MEKSADAEFIHHLFRENNELRAKYTGLQRELYNKTTQLDNADDEIKQLKLKVDLGDFAKPKPIVSETTEATRKSTPPKNTDTGGHPTTPGGGKDAEEAHFTIERQHAEIKQLRDDLNKSNSAFDEETEKVFNLTRETTTMSAELKELREFKTIAIEKEAEYTAKLLAQAPPEDVEVLQQQIKDLDLARQMLKKQMMEIAVEANFVHNAQQNQLQGVEGLIEGIRREYDEFIQITKLENESFRAMQQAEYESLKGDFEGHKNQSFDEKKKLMMEYQTILSGMQTQFDEYRSTAELLFNVEMMKLEDEIASQALRYEQEIMYVIQAKDKFYSDMMVAKDAKIMGLIEGSDLQSIMQKHEMDMENARKEHAREIERIKSDHETESKNVILLLQRQNVSLESKTEKLQAHLKTMETRMKELLGTIDTKNATIAERDSAKKKLEEEYQAKLAEANTRIAKLSQEKEHLRHKVIRLNLNAKGEGENSIENMIKRLTRDTSTLHSEMEEIGTKYDTVLSENQTLGKKLREREKMVDFLEKEISRRTSEFNDMTRTFEEFLSGRARQARKERASKANQASLEVQKPHSFLGQIGSPQDSNTILRARIPTKEHRSPQRGSGSANIKGDLNLELERGYVYLKRFKNLSKAFATGEFRALANIEQTSDNLPGPWQKTPLYTKMDDANLAIARLYREQHFQGPTPQANPKSPIYQPQTTNAPKNMTAGGVQLYNDGRAHADLALGKQTSNRKADVQNLVIGGKHAQY